MSSPDSVRYLGGEPSLGSRFLFEVDGVEIGLFSSVTGLQVTSRTEDLVEGGQNGYTHRLPGRLRHVAFQIEHQSFANRHVPAGTRRAVDFDFGQDVVEVVQGLDVGVQRRRRRSYRTIEWQRRRTAVPAPGR